jgi:RHS repeat-associated protein
MRSKLDDASDWTNFIHDELTENLICEYTLVSGTFTIKALNTYGLGLISSNRQGTIRYFHFDGLGTTYHLTDTSQIVTDSYTYDAFGVPTSATVSSTNPYRYVGQWGYCDDGAMGGTSEMLLLGVRYYWPKYGRFTPWDPVHDENFYEYVGNSPADQSDPTGFGPLYGRYCGPQNKPGIGKPVDELDKCCKTHDDCFARHRCTAANQAFYRDCWRCNALLCACARKARCRPVIVPIPITTYPWTVTVPSKLNPCEAMRAGILAYACGFVTASGLGGAPNCHGGIY